MAAKKKSPATEQRQWLSSKQCKLCGDVWRRVTVYKSSGRRVKSAPVTCYIKGHKQEPPYSFPNHRESKHATSNTGRSGIAKNTRRTVAA